MMVPSTPKVVILLIVTIVILIFYGFTGHKWALAEEKSFEENIKDYESFATDFANNQIPDFSGDNIQKNYQDYLKPQKSDREFVEKNKQKYEFLKEGDIIDASETRLQKEISSGKVDDPNNINPRDLNQASTIRSLKNDKQSADKANITPKEYLNIASKSEQEKKIFKKDLEEASIKEVLKVIKDPQATFKKHEIDSNCEEENEKNEENKDSTSSLDPKLNKYKITRKIRKTEEEQKSCEESEPANFQCPRKLSLTCKKSSQCAAAGIDLNSIDSDMDWKYENGVMTVGKIAYARWEAYCKVFEKEVTFNIKNKKHLTEFSLSYVGFDDYMQFSVNEHIVYAGPDAGATKAEIVNKHFRHVVDTGVGLNSCERNTHWQFYPNIDLRSYLKEGKNTVKMKVIVYDLGTGAFQIRAKQHCCDHWVEKWEDKCEQDLKNF